jgi:hypothetical protein
MWALAEMAGTTALQFVKQVGVGTTVSIREQVFGFAVFASSNSGLLVEMQTS